jgi:AcrR family transcriptional regulator
MSTTDITYNGGMSRWQPNTRGRLEQAALELYRERGFDQITVTEIAERAGLTERTFFRYFADKREMLFWGQDRLRDLYVRTIAAAPESAAPLDAVAAALEAAVPVFHERRELVLQRQAVITANPGLQERELLKRTALASAMADALRKRGVPDPAASLAADIGVIAFKTAYARWVSAPDEQDLSVLIRESLDEVKAVTAGR